jgi:hypothetical protein
MEEIEIVFKFRWFNGMPQRNPMYLFRYVDGMEYAVDKLGHVSGMFCFFGDLEEIPPHYKQLYLDIEGLKEAKKLEITWKTVR